MTDPACIAERIETGMAEILKTCDEVLGNAAPAEIVASSVPVRNFSAARSQAHITLAWLRAGRLADAVDSEAVAWQVYYVAIAGSAHPHVVQSGNFSNAQSERASKHRQQKEVKDIIGELAKREASVKELWPEFIGCLDSAGLIP